MSLQFNGCYTILLLSPTLSTNCKKKNKIVKRKPKALKNITYTLNVDLKTQFCKICGNLRYDRQ